MYVIAAILFGIPLTYSARAVVIGPQARRAVAADGRSSLKMPLAGRSLLNRLLRIRFAARFQNAAIDWTLESALPGCVCHAAADFIEAGISKTGRQCAGFSLSSSAASAIGRP